MSLPRLRSSILVRRWIDRFRHDAPDYIARAFTGRRHWPPYSLRTFVGGAENFDEVGPWFVDEFKKLGLFRPDLKILDIGCGCGRLSYPLATDPALRALKIVYTGMDIDLAGVRWCRRNITPRNPRFTFYHANCYNPSYNPNGVMQAADYRFPHPDGSFDLILLTSLCTHILEPELRHYILEVSRLLVPGGVAYATFFLFESPEEIAAGTARHGIAFPFVRDNCAMMCEEYPTNAIAYNERFVRDLIQQAGLQVMEPTRYGIQDVLMLTRPS